MTLVSKKVRYALHGLGYIARRSSTDGRPVPFDQVLAYLRAYSPRLTLSEGYIAKVFQEISRAGLTSSTPGPGGGYLLTRPPEQIHLIEIIEALEGPVREDCCLLSVGGCPNQGNCGVGAVIREAEASFHRFFHGETVATLVRRMTFPPEASLVRADVSMRKRD